MPNDDPSPNGNTPKFNMPTELHFERGPVTCRRCRQEFKHFVIEVIENITQLRCGDVLILNTRMACMHCGWVFAWDVKTNELEKIAITYGELSAKIERYSPE